MPAASRSILSDSFPAERRAEMWNDLVAKKLLRIQWDVPGAGDPNVTLTPVVRANDIEIVSVTSGPAMLTNTPAYAREKDDRFSLYIVTGGNGVTTERGTGETALHQSMGAFMDEGRYYRHHSLSEMTRGFILMLPKARLIEAMPALPDLIAAPFDHSCEPFRLLQSYLGLLHAGAGADDGALARLNADYVHDLIALMFRARGEAQDVARQRGLPETRTAIILSEIERNLGDPKLSGKAVAARVGITERYLQQLMEARGETFSLYLLRLRLEKAFGMLVAQRTMRVSEIAFACGFNDLSYFNRSFKKRFGEAPRAFRG